MSDRQKQIPTTPKQLLLEAADIIRQRGLAKRCLLSSDGKVCAVGAMYFALGMGDKIRPVLGLSDGDVKDFARSEAECLLLKSLEVIGLRSSLAGWNDRPERTAQDVINLFEKTALEIKE